MSTSVTTDSLRPMTEVQIRQTREFIESLKEDCQTYWDMVEIGDVRERDLTVTPELVILWADAVEDYNRWYEGWRMNTWRIPGESPFGGAIVPPMMISHFVLLAWNCAQRGFAHDRRDRHIATVLAGIRRRHARAPLQKEAILPDDICAW